MEVLQRLGQVLGPGAVMDYKYDTSLAQDPGFLLALQLSAAHSERGPPVPSVIINFAEDSATVTTTLKRSNTSVILLFASKHTILQSRGEAFASELRSLLHSGHFLHAQ